MKKELKEQLFEKAWEENKNQYLISLEDAYAIIDQLDEPAINLESLINEIQRQFNENDYWEAEDVRDMAIDVINEFKSTNKPELTQDQVDKYLHERNFVAVDAMMVDQTGMQNKLVIEKPVIPAFVADWIKGKERYTAFELFYEIDEDSISKWLYEGTQEESRAREIILLQALDGEYEIEKEKNYYVLNHKGKTMLYKSFQGIVDQSRGYKLLDIAGDEKGYQFTEAEIKAIDERYWAFAEEVTE